MGSSEVSGGLCVSINGNDTPAIRNAMKSDACDRFALLEATSVPGLQNLFVVSTLADQRRKNFFEWLQRRFFQSK